MRRRRILNLKKKNLLLGGEEEGQDRSPQVLHLRKKRIPHHLLLHQNLLQQRKRKKKSDKWGRYYQSSWLWNIIVGSVFIFSPPVVFYYHIACYGTDYYCDLAAPVQSILNGTSFYEAIGQFIPYPTFESLQIVAIWTSFQAVLYLYLPGPIGYGQKTPAGLELPYNVNGFRAFILSNVLFVLLSDPRFGLNLFNPTIFFDHRGALLAVANIFGYLLSIYAYIKAHFNPTHPDDVKFSGNFIYDFFMGAEFNPRIGDFDFKLFFNGRPGIIAWNIINISFMYKQYEIYSRVSNSLILVTFLHFLYIIDFFYNEDWYLRTIDISHDHYGWYLGWGDVTWLPFMYTLQGLYLVFNPVELSWPMFAFVLGLGGLGYAIFRGTNNQKNDFRKTNGEMMIWGKPATYIVAEYKTSDKKKHKSLLLTSGFWGLSRHFNYLGDFAISFAYCAACGFGSFYPYFYIVFMIILLVARTERDNTRCKEKYGKKWDEYCEKVPYKILPYVY